mmetsp:Transcript_76496/g.224528  ORF Transcript_76496/g.224528 Transcript_76496/m.224528 type:complete len:387 (-) Transcript_76496:377-1537(-)
MGMEENGDKPGSEYFRELLQLFPSAHLEDYYKNGQWQVETIQMDTELIDAHRRESGAPDPPPLETVKLPPIPQAPKIPYSGAAGVIRPTSASGALRPAPGVPSANPALTLGALGRGLASGLLANAKAAQQRITPLKTPLKAVAAAAKRPLMNPSTAAGASTAAGGSAAELRQISLFIQKWKLEETKGKLLLARLTPSRRRWVMANFKGSTSLEQYIHHCDKTNAWAAASVSSHASPSVAGRASAASSILSANLKRPLAAAASDASKRLRTTSGAAAPLRAPHPPAAPPNPALLRSAAANRAWLTSSVRPASAPRPKPAGYTPAAPSVARSAAPKPLAKPSAPRPSGLSSALRAGSRPASAPAAKPSGAKAGGLEKPGSLIRSLLQR